MVPLHSHSHYSALDGLAKPSEMAARCEEIGIEACGLTDHDVVAGHYEFYKVMSEAGIKPILGIETYQTLVPRQTNLGARTDPTSKGTPREV
jgi:DNA polymerase-3 subunit alpha